MNSQIQIQLNYININFKFKKEVKKENAETRYHELALFSFVFDIKG